MQLVFKDNYINTSAYGVPNVTLDATSQSLMRIQDNEGFDGVGAVTPPATPAASVAVVNNTGLRANIYISGGSVNTVAVNRVNLVTYSPNQPGNNMVNLRQGDSLQMAYPSVTLTWQFL